MSPSDAKRQLSITIDLDRVRVEILLDYLNEAPRGILASSYTSHVHSVEELYFTQYGSLTLELADEEITLYEGDLLLIAPGTVHRVTACSEGVQRFNLRFTIYAPQGMISGARLPWILHHPDDGERAEIAFAIGVLRRISGAMRPLEFCRVKAYYAILLSHALEQLIPQCGDAMPERQNRLVQHVRIDDFFFYRIHEQVTLSDLAKELSYSPAQTSRILREYYGMGFTEMLFRARLARAKEMLESGASREEAASACGYTTRQGFDAFLRRAGFT